MEKANRTSSSPARRLHSFIGKGRADKKVLQKPAKDYIAAEFSVDPHDTLEIYRSYSVILSLLRQTKIALEKSDSLMKAPCLNAIPRIASALSKMQLDQGWVLVNQPITDGDFDLLAIAAQILESDGYELLLTEEELSEFTTEAEELESEIREARLPSDLKVLLNQLFDSLRQSLKDYPVSGVDGLKSALASAYGQIILEAEVIAPHKEEGALIKVWGWFGKINTAVSTIGHAHNAGKLISDVIDRLPG